MNMKKDFNVYCYSYVMKRLAELQGVKVKASKLWFDITKDYYLSDKFCNSKEETHGYKNQWLKEFIGFTYYAEREGHPKALLLKDDLMLARMVVCGVKKLLERSKYLMDNAKNEIELTDSVIDTLVLELKNCNVDYIKWN